jgi:predicted PurR-regulated permease PerM
VLQFIDPYFIKPKLFGNSLGVSGLMILIAVIVFGKLFGMLGILFAIPAAAIIEFTYNQLLLPYLENRKKNRQASSPAQ